MGFSVQKPPGLAAGVEGGVFWLALARQAPRPGAFSHVQERHRPYVQPGPGGYQAVAAAPKRVGHRLLAGPINRLKRVSTMKRTYQPSKIRRARTHGFLARMRSRGGRAVINARRAKGRKRLSV